MPLNKLDDARICAPDLSPGRYSDGGNLYLKVSRNLTRSWVFMYSVRNQRRRELGLGSFPAVSLERAREKAAKARQTLTEGGDPSVALRKDALAEETGLLQDGGEGPARHDPPLQPDLPPNGAVFQRIEVDIEIVGIRRLGTAKWEISGWAPAPALD